MWAVVAEKFFWGINAIGVGQGIKSVGEAVSSVGTGIRDSVTGEKHERELAKIENEKDGIKRDVEKYKAEQLKHAYSQVQTYCEAAKQISKDRKDIEIRRCDLVSQEMSEDTQKRLEYSNRIVDRLGYEKILSKEKTKRDLGTTTPICVVAILCGTYLLSNAKSHEYVKQFTAFILIATAFMITYRSYLSHENYEANKSKSINEMYNRFFEKMPDYQQFWRHCSNSEAPPNSAHEEEQVSQRRIELVD